MGNFEEWWHQQFKNCTALSPLQFFTSGLRSRTQPPGTMGPCIPSSSSSLIFLHLLLHLNTPNHTAEVVVVLRLHHHLHHTLPHPSAKVVVVVVVLRFNPILLHTIPRSSLCTPSLAPPVACPSTLHTALRCLLDDFCLGNFLFFIGTAPNFQNMSAVPLSLIGYLGRHLKSCYMP